MDRGGRGSGRGRARAAAGSSRASTVNAEASTSRTSATPTPGRTPSTSRTARGAASSTGRFRPKNVRRDEAERDTLARQEEKKASERAAEERRARGRGRFRSKRSRGDAMGARGGMARHIGAASGPFSSSSAASSSRAGGGWFGGGGGGGVGGGGGGFSSRSGVKSERGAPGFGQGREGHSRERRINADRLHVMEPDEELGSEDEATMAALSARATSVMPMGIYRKEHKEAEVIVATTAELEAAENAGEEESLWVDGDGSDGPPPPEQHVEEGVWDTGEKKPVVVKKEPGTEDEMDIDSKPEAESPGPKDSKPKVELKVKKAPPQDPEDKVIQSDLELLAGELGAVTVTEENGETKTEGPASKDGRMYLFQMPPVLPPLKQSAAPQPKSKVKDEPAEFNMADAPPATGDSAPVDLTEGEAREEDRDDDPDGREGFMPSLLSEGGVVGKLNVRKSGKVELDWGGMELEMNPATGMNFLTTAVIMEENDEKAAPGVIGGDSIGMGKIMGRFVLAPVWREEEEWDVAPEELNVQQPVEGS